MKLSRQAKLSSFDLARKERGKPPRHQSRSQESDPVSLRSKGESSTNSIRPARVSDTDLMIPGDALPREEASRILGAIGQNPQHIEETGHHLDFIQNNGALERTQHQFGVLQPLKI